MADKIVGSLGPYNIVAITLHGHELETAAMNFVTDAQAIRVAGWLRRNGVDCTIMSQDAYDEIRTKERADNER